MGAGLCVDVDALVKHHPSKNSEQPHGACTSYGVRPRGLPLRQAARIRVLRLRSLGLKLCRGVRSGDGDDLGEEEAGCGEALVVGDGEGGVYAPSGETEEVLLVGSLLVGDDVGGSEEPECAVDAAT